MYTVLNPSPTPAAVAAARCAHLTDAPGDLSGLVRRAVATMAVFEPSRRIDVALHDADEPLVIDATRVCDALVRVLSNACRYSAADTCVRLSSRIEQAHDGEPYLVMTIADRGIGMTPPQMQRAFDPFWRADPSAGGRGAGLGLGLGIARDRIESQRGWITLRSAPGIGTEVELWVPADGLQEAALAA
jgi:signal transduction histidine kinase